MAHGSRYKVAFRRRREGKTDYKARLRLIELDRSRMVVRITNKHTIAQIITVDSDGDKIIVSAHSNELKKLGWLGNCKNTSAAYLTGFLCGKKALKNGINETILDIGLKSPTKGSKQFSALKGVLDAGLNIPHNDKILPSEERIRGEHIAKYAESLDDEEIAKRFSQYLQEGLSPLNLPEHFDEIKKKIENEV